MLPNGRILVLAGAAHGPEAPFQLFVVDTKAENPVAKPLGVFVWFLRPRRERPRRRRAAEQRDDSASFQSVAPSGETATFLLGRRTYSHGAAIGNPFRTVTLTHYLDPL